MKIIKWDDTKISNWAGGTSSCIYIKPEEAEGAKRNFDIMVTSATCELDESIFSDYTGFTRFISPIDGDLVLRVQSDEIVLKPNMVYKFSGAIDVAGLSKVRDYNLIIKDGYEADLKSFSLANDKTIDIKDKNILIQSFEGDIKFKLNDEEYILNKKDALLIQDEGKLYLSSEKAISVFISEF